MSVCKLQMYQYALAGNKIKEDNYILTITTSRNNVEKSPLKKKDMGITPFLYTLRVRKPDESMKPLNYIKNPQRRVNVEN